MAEPPTIPERIVEEDWVLRGLRAIVAGIGDTELRDASRYWEAEKSGVAIAAEAAAVKATAKKVLSQLETLLKPLIDSGGASAEWVIEFVSGLNIPDGTIANFVAGETQEAQRIALGTIITTLYDETLKADEAAKDYLGRTPGAAAFTNFRRLVGASMRLQVGDLLVGSVAGSIPLGIGHGLEQIAERLDKAIALEDALEEVIQVPMEAVITDGLKKHYNRIIKPMDMSRDEALSALIQGKIDRATFDKIFDNEGIRLDVRDTLIDMKESNLNDAQMRTLWQWGQIDHARIVSEIRQRTKGAEQSELIAGLLEGQRLRDLKDEYVSRNRRLFVDCVISEQELRGVLSEVKYSQEEADQAIKNDLVARRQRTFLPTSDMFKAVHLGLMDLNDAINSLQCRGWTYDDAVTEAALRLQEKLPECESVKLKDSATISLLQALGSAAGISGKLLSANVLKYLQCLNLQNLLLPPIAQLSADKTELTGEGRVKLTWSTQLATSAEISPLLGPVPLSGETGVDVKRSQGFRLTAKSPIGTSYATIFVNVGAGPTTL